MTTSDRDALVAMMKQYAIDDRDVSRLFSWLGTSWREWQVFVTQVQMVDVIALRSAAGLATPLGRLKTLFDNVPEYVAPETKEAVDAALQAQKARMQQLETLEENEIMRGVGNGEENKFLSTGVVDSTTWLVYAKGTETLKMFANRIGQMDTFSNVRAISLIGAKISHLYEEESRIVPLLDLELEENDNLLLLDLRGCPLEATSSNWTALRSILEKFRNCTVLLTHTPMGSVDSKAYLCELPYDVLVRVTWIYHEFLAAGGWRIVFAGMPRGVERLVRDSHCIVHATMKALSKNEVTK